MSDEELLAAMGYPADAKHREILKSAKTFAPPDGKPHTPEELRPICEDIIAKRDLQQTRSEPPSSESRGAVSAANTGDAGRDRDPPEPVPWSEAAYGPLCRAPFTFVPVNETVVGAPETPPLDRPGGGRLDARLMVDWRIETPFLVAAGDNANAAQPFTLGGPEAWAIPGATLRGMVRSALECLAHARLWQINRNYRFALRDFRHDRYKVLLEGGVGDGDLKAGWLTRVDEDGGDFDPETAEVAITPCAGWGRVAIDDMQPLLSGGESWAKLERAAKYRRSDQGLKRNYDLNWRSVEGFRTPAAFKRYSDQHDKPLWRPVASGGDEDGIFVFSGAATSEKRKKYEYVFFDDPDATPVPIAKDRWREFLVVNTTQGDKTREPDGAWRDFIVHEHGAGPHKTEKIRFERGQRIPVFYIGNLNENEHDPEFSFGLTRLYRLPHGRSVGAMAPSGHRADSPGAPGREDFAPDFVEALFGWVHEDAKKPEDVARRGRVAFGFARPAEGAVFEPWPKAGAVPAIQGAPKPSFAPFYLVGPVKDWSSDHATLAGRKRYLPKAGDGEDAVELIRAGIDRTKQDVDDGKGTSDKIATNLRFLKPVSPNAAFRSEIRLSNVTEAELGAILWALTLGADAEGAKRRHMVGRGKPFGAGRAGVAMVKMSLRRHAAPDTREKSEWRIGGQDRGALAPFMTKFETTMDAELGGAGTWAKSETTTKFLNACLPRAAGDARAHYLAFAKGTRSDDPPPKDENEKRGNGWRFQALRTAAGKRAHDAPLRLLTRAPPRG